MKPNLSSSNLGGCPRIEASRGKADLSRAGCPADLAPMGFFSRIEATGILTQGQLGISIRQIKRLVQRYREQGERHASH